MAKKTIFVLLLAIGVMAASASAQRGDIAFGFSTLTASSPSSSIVNSGNPYAPSMGGGTYLSFSGDYTPWKQFGFGAEVSWRASLNLYLGYQPYRPIFYNVNAVYAPKFNDRVGADLIAGIGAESLRFYNNYYTCSYISGCTNYTSSNHFMGVFGGGLDRQIRRSGEDVDVLLKSGRMHGFMSLRFPWTWGSVSSLDWTVNLTSQIPMMLDIELASGRANLELSALQITELDIKSSSSEMVIALPTHAGQTSMKVQASTGLIIIRVPPEVGAHIRTSNARSSGFEIDLARFPMTEKAGEYRSANYDAAANRVDLQLETAYNAVQIV